MLDIANKQQDSSLPFLAYAIQNRLISDSKEFLVNNIPVISYTINDSIYFFGTVYYAFLGSIRKSGSVVSINSEDIFGYKIDFEEVIKTQQQSNFQENNYSNPLYYYSFATTNNIGHYIWNEVSALFFLVKSGLIHHFDYVYIGNYDFLGLGKTLKTMGVTCRRKRKSSKAILPTKAGSRIFSKECRDFILNKYEIKNSAVDRSRVIGIQIRTSDRAWNNSPREIAGFIEKLHSFDSRMRFVIDGHSSWSRFNRKGNQYREELSFYNKILRNIQNSEIQISSTIGKSFSVKLKELGSSLLVIGPIGSGGIISNWLLNRETICFGQVSYYGWTQADSEELTFKGRSKIHYFPHDFLHFNEAGDYSTDLKELYKYTINVIESLPKE